MICIYVGTFISQINDLSLFFNELYSCMLHLDSHISHFASCQKGVYLKDASGSDITKVLDAKGLQRR